MADANVSLPTKIVVIGNGFDISLGYNTRYSDFIKSKIFKDLVNQNNHIAKHLVDIQGEKNWVDIELELADYAKSKADVFNIATFKRFFIQLKTALTTYLNAEYDRIRAQCGYSKFHEINRNDITGIYSLNFTPTAFSIKDNSNEDWKQNIFFVHGQAHSRFNNIVFGVSDQSVPEQFNFLYKSDHHAYGSINLTKAILDADEVHFYGLSFGETDNNHFETAFSNLRDKKLIFYVYGLDGYEGVRNRLITLSKNGLAGLKTNNEVLFIDTFDGHKTVVTQEWLNKQYTQSK
jgi:Bacteriophage abortive infection AbiH